LVERTSILVLPTNQFSVCTYHFLMMDIMMAIFYIYSSYSWKSGQSRRTTNVLYRVYQPNNIWINLWCYR